MLRFYAPCKLAFLDRFKGYKNGTLIENRGVLKNEFYLHHQLEFEYNQVTNSIPKFWRDTLARNSANIKSRFLQKHYLMRKHQIYCLNRVHGREITS